MRKPISSKKPWIHLSFTEDMAQFDLFDIDPDMHLREEDLDEEDGLETE